MRRFVTLIWRSVVRMENANVTAVMMSAGATSAGAYLNTCATYTSDSSDVSEVEYTAEKSMEHREFMYCILYESCPALYFVKNDAGRLIMRDIVAASTSRSSCVETREDTSAFTASVITVLIPTHR